MKKIKQLTQDTINKIAAGEVVERPASVVKELLDNAIDAGARQITIRISNGGKKLIQVEDNGCGISSDELALAFKSHTTSKIANINDLNNLMTMGFRGEALSTIQSIAKVKILSKEQDADKAYELIVDESLKNKPKQAARTDGTTVIVEDIFYNVPARLRFLRQDQTEYRKILELLNSYFLINPTIQFTLYKDGKLIKKLLAQDPGDNRKISERRVQDVIKSEWVNDMIFVSGNLNGVKVTGYVAAPKYHCKKTAYQYVFINGRPIEDRGIAKSVSMGFSRYIPEGSKIPFVISLEIDPALVDVNVHPRKEEVAFINPYRVYSAVEQSVNSAIKKDKSYDVRARDYRESESFGYSKSAMPENSFADKYGSSGPSSNYRTKPASEAMIQSGMRFSKEILSPAGPDEIETSRFDYNQAPVNFSQIFNKYIIIEFEDRFLVMDQHACAERITFEKLMQRNDEIKIDRQKLLIPLPISLDEAQLSFIRENEKFFNSLGFELEFSGKKVDIKEVPIDFVGADYKLMLEEIYALAEYENEDSIKEPIEQRKGDIIATMACHTSIRSGQKLATEQMKSLWEQLRRCENPYSCPHGRPIVWEVKLSELDGKFER